VTSSSSGPRARHSHCEGEMVSLTGNRTGLLWPCATVVSRMDPLLPQVDSSHRWHIAAVATCCLATRNSDLCLTCVHTLQCVGMCQHNMQQQTGTLSDRRLLRQLNKKCGYEGSNVIRKVLWPSRPWLPYILVRISKYCGIFARSKNCEARKTAFVSERL
jgi:hypothetical protein